MEPCLSKGQIDMIQKDVKTLESRLNRHSEKIDQIHDDNLSIEKHTAVLETLVKETKNFNEQMYKQLDENQRNQNITVEKLFKSMEVSQREQNSINKDLEKTLVSITEGLKDVITEQTNTTEKLNTMAQTTSSRFECTEDRINSIDNKTKFDLIPLIMTKVVPILLGAGLIYIISTMV